MVPASVPWKLIVTYCGWMFVVSWSLQLTAIATTTGLADPVMRFWLAGTMLSPSIVTFFFLRFHPELKSKLMWKPSWKLISTTFLSVLVPMLFGLIVVAVFESKHWGTSTWFAFSAEQVVISGGPFMLGLGPQSWIIFALNLFITGFSFALINSFFAAGEELAWRGLLQGLLVERLGVWKGLMLLGFIWSMWHLPIQLFGYNYPENPVIGSLIISPVIMIGYSFFMGWLTVHSKSFIPAAMAHGAGNGIQQGIISQIEIATPELYVYLTRLFTSITIGFIFMYFLTKGKSKAKIDNGSAKDLEF